MARIPTITGVAGRQPIRVSVPSAEVSVPTPTGGLAIARGLASAGAAIARVGEQKKRAADARVLTQFDTALIEATARATTAANEADPNDASDVFDGIMEEFSQSQIVPEPDPDIRLSKENSFARNTAARRASIRASSLARISRVANQELDGSLELDVIEFVDADNEAELLDIEMRIVEKVTRHIGTSLTEAQGQLIIKNTLLEARSKRAIKEIGALGEGLSTAPLANMENIVIAMGKATKNTGLPTNEVVRRGVLLGAELAAIQGDPDRVEAILNLGVDMSESDKTRIRALAKSTLSRNVDARRKEAMQGFNDAIAANVPIETIISQSREALARNDIHKSDQVAIVNSAFFRDAEDAIPGFKTIEEYTEYIDSIIDKGTPETAGLLDQSQKRQLLSLYAANTKAREAANNFEQFRVSRREISKDTKSQAWANSRTTEFMAQKAREIIGDKGQSLPEGASDEEVLAIIRANPNRDEVLNDLLKMDQFALEQMAHTGMLSEDLVSRVKAGMNSEETMKGAASRLEFLRDTSPATRVAYRRYFNEEARAFFEDWARNAKILPAERSYEIAIDGAKQRVSAADSPFATEDAKEVFNEALLDKAPDMGAPVDDISEIPQKILDVFHDSAENIHRKSEGRISREDSAEIALRQMLRTVGPTSIGRGKRWTVGPMDKPETVDDLSNDVAFTINRLNQDDLLFDLPVNEKGKPEVFEPIPVVKAGRERVVFREGIERRFVEVTPRQAEARNVEATKDWMKRHLVFVRSDVTKNGEPSWYVFYQHNDVSLPVQIMTPTGRMIKGAPGEPDEPEMEQLKLNRDAKGSFTTMTRAEEGERETRFQDMIETLERNRFRQMLFGEETTRFFREVSPNVGRAQRTIKAAFEGFEELVLRGLVPLLEPPPRKSIAESMPPKQRE